jgi:putative transposase
MRYTFIQEHSKLWPVRRMCKVLQVHPSGFYAWQQAPMSERGRVLGLIKQSSLECGAVYGYRKVKKD